jgi:DNA-binding HxlR family transcriptional regulator
LTLLGDKWSLLVMRDVLLRGKAHYREFLASEERIATNIMADRLSRLEAVGLLPVALPGLAPATATVPPGTGRAGPAR